jgi:hypothetical protein
MSIARLELRGPIGVQLACSGGGCRRTAHSYGKCEADAG